MAEFDDLEMIQQEEHPMVLPLANIHAEKLANRLNDIEKCINRCRTNLHHSAARVLHVVDANAHGNRSWHDVAIQVDAV
jgi:hypothetical protein